MEGDDKEFNLASVELEEILADGPVAAKAAMGAVSRLSVIITNEDKEEEDTGFELSSWVLFFFSMRNYTCKLKYVIYSTDCVIYIG